VSHLKKYIKEIGQKTKDDRLKKRAKDLVRRWHDMVEEHSSVLTNAASIFQGDSINDQNLHSGPVSHQVSEPLVHPVLRSSARLRSRASTSPGGVMMSSSSIGITSSSNIQRKRSPRVSSVHGKKMSCHEVQTTTTGNTFAQMATATAVKTDAVPRTCGSFKKPRKRSQRVDSKEMSFTPSKPDVQCERAVTRSAGVIKAKVTTATPKVMNVDKSVCDPVAMASATDSITTTNPGTSTNVPKGMFTAQCVNVPNFALTSDNTASNAPEPATRVSPVDFAMLPSKQILPGCTSDYLTELQAFKERTSRMRTTKQLAAFVQRKGRPSASKGNLKESPSDVAKFKEEHIKRYIATQSKYCHMGEDPEEAKQEILSKLPPLDVGVICWSRDEFKPPKEVTEELVTMLHTEHLDGINGTFNVGAKPGEVGEFREWNEEVSKVSYNGELLQIAPYVLLE
ncbi:hypothetical protein C0J52_08150, partial [Blattella germanica]